MLNNEELIIYQIFESIQFKDELLTVIYDYGYSLIQERVLVIKIQSRVGLILGQRSIGKTTVIALPLVYVIDLSNKQTKVLMLARTQELAAYNMNIIIALSSYLKVSNYSFSVINSISGDISILQNGVQIISGIYERELNLILRKELIVNHLKI